MIALLVSSVALGGELQFAPDRPGFGDSTLTTGAGHATVEIGFAAELGQGSTTLRTGGLLGRIGVDDGVEVRIRLPDAFVTDGGFGLDPGGVGVKVGGAVNERWSSSVVAEFVVDPDEDDGVAVGGFLEGNVALNLDQFGVWLVGSAAGTDAIAAFAGGGLGYTVDEAGIYVNAGHVFGGPTLAGVGGFLLPAEAFQVDVGIDVAFQQGEGQRFLPSVGVAFGI